ncbi:AraC family transcriptional regulator [Paenibacillus cremeus]|uniref:Helix-turn-helix transcriptional regulator n=1 Tax=Paenibacillus cremeus TaxID=2163881 RepID=A0A559KFV1_9BACL|nr:AraC family transcriptional regulator [Paenibacillus cremeus]TVY11005.1 helix-turn-helix transcriptional regulator [Paenibacillus cremeus]
MIRRKGSFYRNSLVMIMLIASLPGIVMGLVTYWTVTGKVETELQRQQQNKVVQQSKNLEAQFANLELVFSHWAFDPNLGAKLRELNFASDYNEVQALYQTLLVIEGSSPLIDKAELYLAVPRPVMINKDGYKFQNDAASRQQYLDMMKREKSIFWMDAAGMPGPKDVSGGTTLSLINKLPGGLGEPYGLLMATLNKHRLEEQLKSVNSLSEGSTLLLSGDSKWDISSNGSKTAFDSAVEKAYRSRGASGESFLFSYDKEVYSVSVSQFFRLGIPWVILSAAPLSSITSPVLLISKVILLVSFGGLLLAVALAWFGSVRIYSPLGRLYRKVSGEISRGDHKDELEWIEMKWDTLTKESEHLKSRLDLQQPMMREGFLMQLVQGYLFSLTETEAHERIKQFGLDIQGKQIAALFVQVRGMNGADARFTQGDEELVAFAVGNIAKELGDNRCLPCEALNFHDLSLGLFLTLPVEWSQEECKEELRAFGEELMRIIEHILKLQAVVVMGNTTTQLHRVPYLFEESRQLLNYRDFSSTSTLIDVSQLSRTSTHLEFPYPFLLEKEIIHAVRTGSQEEAAPLVHQFIQELTASGVKKVILQQGIYQLVGSVQHAMLQSGINPISMFGGANLFQELSQLNEPDEMQRWLETRVVGAYIQEVAGKADFRIKQVVENVLLFIQQHYGTNLSLESCADHFELTPYTLSRAIKQVTGINFIDYLTNLRIGHAKELLRTTSMKINEIADEVGYQQTYFNRIFKKAEGVSPSQYREMFQRD